MVCHFSSATPPSVMWAQRASTVLLTICLEDCAKPEIVLKADSLYFSGIGGPDKKPYKLTINFFKEIDPDVSFWDFNNVQLTKTNFQKSVHAVRDRVIEFVLKKKNDEGPFWPRLTNEKVKYHWLKVDFNKWKDEDDSEDEVEGGGLGGMGGMGGMGEMDLESVRHLNIQQQLNLIPKFSDDEKHGKPKTQHGRSKY